MSASGGREPTVYLPGLNGIRAIAAGGVLITHITLRLKEFGLDPYIFGAFADGKPRGLDLAGFGVSMFFALSGFLITYLMILERRRGAFSVRKFYARRALRIWPLYYAYIAICVTVLVLARVDFDGRMLPYYLLLAANVPLVLDRIIPLIGHYWSLGVEEQFYAVWPWVARLRERAILAVALGVAAVLVSAKLILHVATPGSLLEAAIHVTRVHCMLFGAVGALLLLRGGSRVVGAVCSVAGQGLAWVMFIAVALNRFHVASVIDNEIVAAMTVALILGQVSGRGLMSLENGLFRRLGRVSYGIYVVHPLIIDVFERMSSSLGGLGRPMRYVVVYGGISLATIALAEVSYKYLEAPFLRIKARRFTVIESTADGRARG